MRLISHRGNINGKIVDRENDPVYIQEAIDLGYDVEIDVWVINDKVFLGHDEPQYEISPIDLIDFKLYNSRYWCHAKNAEALMWLEKNRFAHYFWHNIDDYTLTSSGYIWVYPNKELLDNSICVLPELHDQEIPNFIYGICSDYIEQYKND
jgi:hypothetical protein